MTKRQTISQSPDHAAFVRLCLLPASMLQAGSIIGSVIAFAVSDLLGRKRTAQMACLLWILGTIVWFTSAHGVGRGDGNLSQLLGGRFLAGLGVGITPVVAPTYLAEIAPRAIRGLCVCIFSGSVYIGILLGYCEYLPRRVSVKGLVCAGDELTRPLITSTRGQLRYKSQHLRRVCSAVENSRST